MVTIELSFPAGRFHANPWGRHVNEGVPEWPPSPYRLIRGVFDAWKRKRPDWPEERVRPLLEALSGRPRFRLPEAGAAHTRSFLNQNERDPSKKQLVFDAFVVLARESSVWAWWPDVELPEDQRSDLEELLSLLDYLGRSESWVRATLRAGDLNLSPNCIPADEARGTEEVEMVRVACAVPPEHYVAETPPGSGGRKAKGRSWVDCLAVTTAEVHAERRDLPPAMELVAYVRSSRCFEIVRRGRRAASGGPVHGVLYSLESKVRPRVLETVSVAERFRVAAMSQDGRLREDRRDVSPRFSGKNCDSSPLKGHQHLFFLPVDLDADGRIDGLYAVCREPLEGLEMVALDRVNWLWQSRGRPDIRLTPVRWGTRRELFPPAHRFASVTPFVPARHHRRGRGPFQEWLHGEVRRELAFLGLPDPSSVGPLRTPPSRRGVSSGPATLRWIEFQRSRKGDRPRPAYGFELEFAEPVVGPIALGYASHFGLGLFLPVV